MAVRAPLGSEATACCNRSVSGIGRQDPGLQRPLRPGAGGNWSCGERCASSPPARKGRRQVLSPAGVRDRTPPTPEQREKQSRVQRPKVQFPRSPSGALCPPPDLGLSEPLSFRIPKEPGPCGHPLGGPSPRGEDWKRGDMFSTPFFASHRGPTSQPRSLPAPPPAASSGRRPLPHAPVRFPT